MPTATHAKLWTGFDGRVIPDAPLASHTSMGVGGAADWLVEPSTVEGYAEAVRRAREADLPLRVLGGGSNLLIADAGVDGVVLRLRGGVPARLDRTGVRVRAGGGVPLQALVRKTAAWGLAGLEACTGIPGTVGGGLAGNAGGRYGEIGDVLAEVTVLDPEGETRTLAREEVRFGYRDSSLRGAVVLEGAFDLDPEDPGRATDRLRRYTAEKRSTQPTRAQSAGCAFRNPKGDSAGRLIDEAGLKGTRVGGAEVSELHANFLITRAGTTADDVMRLIDRIREEVRRRTGVELELELQVWSR